LKNIKNYYIIIIKKVEDKMKSIEYQTLKIPPWERWMLYSMYEQKQKEKTKNEKKLNRGTRCCEKT